MFFLRFCLFFLSVPVFSQKTVDKAPALVYNFLVRDPFPVVEGYRSGHNEAVLKNYRSDLRDLRKILDFTGFLAIFFVLCEKSFSQFSRTFHN